MLRLVPIALQQVQAVPADHSAAAAWEAVAALAEEALEAAVAVADVEDNYRISYFGQQ